MIIGISGCHSQGKTTLVEALKQHEQFKDFEFKSGLTRDLHKIGIPINENGNDITQLYVMCKHYEYAQLTGNVVLDRCALDGLAYTQVILENNQDTDFKHVLGMLARKCFQKYDVIFYTKPELKLVDDGVRTCKMEFFEKVKSSFEYWIDAMKFNKRPVPIIEISGTVEQRVDQVIEAIDRLKISN